MAIKLRHKDDGRIIIHAGNHPLGQSDLTLCGNDITGDIDEFLGYTKEKITCTHCIAIIMHGKAFKKSELKL